MGPFTGQAVYFTIETDYNLAWMKRIKGFFKKILALRTRTKIIGIIVILVVLFLIFRGKGKPTPLQFAGVQVGSIQSIVSASGILNGKKSISLKFSVPGKLKYLGVGSGEMVIPGETIATIDSTEL